MQLPCKHIFAFCQRCGVSLYEPSLCAVRWRKDYYQSCHRALCQSKEQASSIALVNIHQLSANSSILSAQEKYRKAFNVAQKLATFVTNERLSSHNEMSQQGEDVAIDKLSMKGATIMSTFNIHIYMQILMMMVLL